MKKIIWAFGLLVSCVAVEGSATSKNAPEPALHNTASGVISKPLTTPLKSVAVSRFTGLEKRFVTLKPNVQVTKGNLMRGMKKNSLLVVVRNRSGEPAYKGLQLFVVKNAQNSGNSSDHDQYFGRGPVLSGEMRIYKIHDKASSSVSLMEFDRGATSLWWRSKRPIQSGLPLVLTLLPNHKIRVTRTFNDIIAK